jgi:hypothetical protein
MNEEQDLKIYMKDGKLILEIGINQLDGHDFHDTIPALKFKDRDVWVEDVIAELNREEEDGSTPVSELLDRVMNSALENGSMGIASDSPISFGMCMICQRMCVPIGYDEVCDECVDINE